MVIFVDFGRFRILYI